MRPRPLTVVLVALLTVFAGCSGATAPAETGDGQPGGSVSVDVQPDADGGAVNFWISDERNDIDDFEHLNVTITKVAFHRAGADDANESDAEDEDSDAGGNGSDDGPPSDAGPPDDVGESESEGNESDAADGGLPESAGGAEDGGPSAEDADWIVQEVDDRTVDLTRLQGENATLIGTFDVPEGEYDKVFLYVGGIDATRNGSGESADVRLPGGRLHLNQGFTVGANASPDFVFDVSVIRAGNSGQYVLKPVASQSGTDVPIRDADAPGTGPPAHAGPPENRENGSGPPEDRGNGNGPPDHAGPPEDRGNASATNGEDDDGPPEDAGPPEDRGPNDGSDGDDTNADRQESETDEIEETENEEAESDGDGGTDGTPT